MKNEAFKFCMFSLKFVILKLVLDELLPELRQNFQKKIKSVESLMKSYKTYRNCEKNAAESFEFLKLVKFALEE